MRAGFCKQVITPPLGQVAFAGYNGRQNFAQGVLDDLYARALVLQPTNDPATWVVLATTDLFMLRRYFVEQVRALASKLTGIPGENICLHGTHTHQGPDTLGIYYPNHDFDGTYLDEAWMAQLARQLAGTIYGATQNTFECKIGSSETFLEGYTVNRREQALFARPSPNPRTIDPQIPLIRVDDLNGQPHVLITGFATHPTFLSTFDEWAAEHVPYVERECQKLLGPDLQIMYFTGQAGDIVPSVIPRGEMKHLAINPTHPMEEHDQVVTITETEEYDEKQFIIHDFEEILSQFPMVSREELLAFLNLELSVIPHLDGRNLILKGKTSIRKLGGAFAKFVAVKFSLYWVKHFAQIFAGKVAGEFPKIAMDDKPSVKITHELVDIDIDDPDMVAAYDALMKKSNPRRVAGGKTAVTTEVQGIQIGDTYICCLPAEPINEIGLRLKQLIKDQGDLKHVFLWELCNDGFGYVVTPFEHEAQGYEVIVFCFGKMNGTYIEQASIAVASRLLGRQILWADVSLPEHVQGPWPQKTLALKKEFLQQLDSGKKANIAKPVKKRAHR